MALDLDLSDLSHLDRIRTVLADNDLQGQFAYLGMAEIHISDAALDLLPAVIERHLAAAGRAAGKAAKVRLIVDPVPIRRGGDNIKDRLSQELASRFDLVTAVLDDGHPVLHADEPILDAASQAAEGADVIVSVGGGTITDVAKIAAMRANVPIHIVVQTAASVDGFTDNFSVVLQNGVKRTLLSRWPEAVLTDTQVIAEAPHHLNAAGFGELLSMFVAPGDWFLAHRLGMDDSFAPVLLDMLALCGAGIEEWSGGIGKGDPQACARLAQALAMRGIVTGVGGTTASLSGMEHLISHMLDMVHGELGEPTGLHGAQVGVGSVIRAAAWEVFCERYAAERPPIETLFPPIDTCKEPVLTAFATLDPTGRIGAECWERYAGKLARWHAARPRVTDFFAAWDTGKAEHDRLIYGAHAIARYLHRAGAPLRYSDLDPAPSAPRLAWVTGNCQYMRERFTVADLLTFAGWWDEDGVARVLARVDEACAAAETLL